MNDAIRQRLRNLIEKFGPTVVKDQRRCQALIRDICGDKTKEARLLIQALELQIPADLTQVGSETPVTIVLARLRHRLEDDLGIRPDVARWAVDTWAIAAGIELPNDPMPPEKPRVVIAALGGLLVTLIGIGVLVAIVRRTPTPNEAPTPDLPADSNVQSKASVHPNKANQPPPKRDPPALSAAEAKQHVGIWEAVEFEVASMGSSKDRRFVFLNASRRYWNPNNLTVMLTPEVIEAMQAEGIPDVATYFRGKRIRVQGEISLYQGRAELKVSRREDLQIVTEATK
jgi:hypothetical protein